MKNLIRLSCIGILLFSIVSCEKSTVVPELSQPQTAETEAPIYYLHTVDGEAVVEELQAEKFDFANTSAPTALKSAKSSNSTSNFAHGIVTTTSPNTLVFSAKTDKNGVHGENYLDGSYFKNVKFNSECLTVEDGQAAHFGGEITAWEPGPELPAVISAAGVDVGWQIFMAAKDVGEGVNAEDELGGGLIIAPPEATLTLAVIEFMYEIPQGTLAALSIETMCDFSAFVYSQGEIPYVFVPGENPTNVQVK